MDNVVWAENTTTQMQLIDNSAQCIAYVFCLREWQVGRARWNENEKCFLLKKCNFPYQGLATQKRPSHSVWQDYIFMYLAVSNIGNMPNHIILLPKQVKHFAKYYINLRKCPRLLILGQSGKISPNLVTLITFMQRSKTGSNQQSIMLNFSVQRCMVGCLSSVSRV